jgi:hypothetical protein
VTSCVGITVSYCLTAVHEGWQTSKRLRTSFIKKSYVFWDVIPHSSMRVSRCFGGTYDLHH